MRGHLASGSCESSGAPYCSTFFVMEKKVSNMTEPFVGQVAYNSFDLKPGDDVRTLALVPIHMQMPEEAESASADVNVKPEAPWRAPHSGKAVPKVSLLPHFGSMVTSSIRRMGYGEFKPLLMRPEEVKHSYIKKAAQALSPHQ